MTLATRPILVTGGTGFVGRVLLPRLQRENLSVRATVRRHDATLPSGVQQVVVSTLMDRQALRSALRGVDSVVHLAARAHVLRRSVTREQVAEYEQINVEGTRCLLEEAAAASVRQFVFVSSVALLPQHSDVALTEQTEPQPATAYGASKLAAEKLVRSILGDANIRYTILRPPLVYGPGMRANMLRLFALADRELPLPLGGVRNRRSLLFVDNLVEAIWHVLGAEGAANETFLLSDGKDFSTPELIAAIARALGRRVWMFSVPVGALRAGAAAVDPIARLSGMPLPSDAVERLVNSLFVDSSYITKRTGFHPPYTAEEGLSRTARWYLSERLPK